MSKKNRNPVKEALEADRKWGMTHRDKKKYSREPPNHHAFDEEVGEALDERSVPNH